MESLTDVEIWDHAVLVSAAGAHVVASMKKTSLLLTEGDILVDLVQAHIPALVGPFYPATLSRILPVKDSPPASCLFLNSFEL